MALPETLSSYLEDWGRIPGVTCKDWDGQSQQWRVERANQAEARRLAVEWVVRGRRFTPCVLEYWRARYVDGRVRSVEGMVKCVFGELGRRERAAIAAAWARKVREAEAVLAADLGLNGRE